jgi:hypothetical protein
VPFDFVLALLAAAALERLWQRLARRDVALSTAR